MNMLALDTSTVVLSVGVQSERGLWLMESDAELRHSELLLELMDTLLRYCGIPAQELDSVACMQGPGSFTGIRIGFAAAKGLALALGIPLIAIPTLDCLAEPYSMWPGLVAPIIDAKKKQVFTALYFKGKRISDFLDSSVPSLADSIRKAESNAEYRNATPTLLTGQDALQFYPQLCAELGADALILNPGYKKSGCRELLDISAKCSIVNRIGDSIYSMPNGIHARPIYLRKSDAELNVPNE